MPPAPFFADMFTDLGRAEAFETAARIMTGGFGLARKLGVRTVRLGATLPKLLFTFDQNKDKFQIDDSDLDITTGHYGTVWLIGEVLKSLTKKTNKERGYKGLK